MKKSVSIVLGILILAGIGFFGYLIYQRNKDSVPPLTPGRKVLSSVFQAKQVFLRKSDCDCQLKGKSFELRDDASFELETLRSGCSDKSIELLVAGSSDEMKGVKRIYIDDISKKGGNDFEGNLQIELNQIGDEKPIRVPSVPVLFKTEGSGQKQVITECRVPSLKAPSHITVISGDKTCALYWKAAIGPGPINYLVCYSTTSKVSADPSRVCVNSTLEKLEFNELENGKKHYFAIQATNPVQNLSWTPEVECVPTKPQN
jgi:hypothetical protein